jgi:hypothetical protein
MEQIVQSLERENFIVTNKDYQFETFYHWATGNGEYSPTALIIDASDDDIPIEAKAEEYIRYLTEIKIKKPNMRLIINLPSQFKYMKNMQRNFVGLGIYDFYFEDNFTVQTIVEWIDNKRTLADVKDMIILEGTGQEDKSSTEKTHEDSETCLQDGSEKESEEDKKGFSSFINEKFRSKMPREQVIEKYVTMVQQSIAFISLSKGAGSTFHALNYASYLKNKGMNVGLYEQPVHLDGRSYLADVFEFFKDDEKQQVSLPHMILDRKPILLEQTPKYKDISIYATDYSQGYINDFKSDQFLRYLNTGKHTIRIMDFGYVPSKWFNNESFIDLLRTFQYLVVVVDLLPTAFVPNFERFDFFKSFQKDSSYQSELVFLINRYDSYIPKEELKRLDLVQALRCPALNAKEVFKAFYDKKIPFDEAKEIEEELETTYNGILTDMEMNGEVQYTKKRRTLSSMLQRVGL